MIFLNIRCKNFYSIVTILSTRQQWKKRAINSTCSYAIRKKKLLNANEFLLIKHNSLSNISIKPGLLCIIRSSVLLGMNQKKKTDINNNILIK